MAPNRLKSEWIARVIALALILAAPIAALSARWLDRSGAVEIHASMPEKGGWLPGNLTARVGEPLHLRLTSDDVVHGFAIGQTDHTPVEVLPGQVTETTLRFDKPGTYTYYCTRWCGPNHWRMRGTIEVHGRTVAQPSPPDPPLYGQLGIDLDAPRHAEPLPERRPSAARGMELIREFTLESLISEFLTANHTRALSPDLTWITLRSDPRTAELSDQGVWDLVALVWSKTTIPSKLTQGQALYDQNCAACHGSSGQGDGVFASQIDTPTDSPSQEFESQATASTDFTNPTSMLAASPALLQGKILRGGMGTGMPSWGVIFTEEETWALVDYLWTFQFEYPTYPHKNSATDASMVDGPLNQSLESSP